MKIKKKSKKKTEKKAEELQVISQLFACNFCGKLSPDMNMCKDCQEHLDGINHDKETYRHYQ